MDDGSVDPNSDLTSTVNDVLLSTKNEKTDANDSTPTSSTDAASSFSGTALIVSEDPISSTSSDVMEREKLLPGNSQENNDKDTVVSKNLLGNDGDVDLLDMSIADVSAEPIIEDVEDIVQDLENLLGEPEPQHDFPTRRKEKTSIEEKDLLASLDDPLGETIEPNLIPQTSTTELPEKSNTNTSVSENVDNANCNKTDNTSEKCQDLEISPEEPCGVVKEIENKETSDVNIKLDEVREATSDQSVDILDTKINQTDDSVESSENTDVAPESNELSVVTSSESVTLAEVENKSSPSFILNKTNEDFEETEKIEDPSMHVTDKEISNPTEQVLEREQLVSHEKQTEETEKCDASQSKTEEELVSQTTSTDQSVEEVSASQGEQISEVVFDVRNDGDSHQSSPENSDNTTESLTDTAEVINDATSPSTAPVDASACSSEEVGGPEVETLKPDIEVEGNVTSSSDLSKEQEPSTEEVEMSEAPNEITECAETAEVQELISTDSNDQNEASAIKLISSIEKNCEESVEQKEAEMSTADEVVTQQNVPSVNTSNDEETPEEVLNQAESVLIEQDSQHNLSVVTSEIESSAEEEKSSETVLEKESETFSEYNATSEQPSQLENPVTEEESPKIQETDSEEKSGDAHLTEDRSPEIILEQSATVTIPDDSLMEEEETTIEDTDLVQQSPMESKEEIVEAAPELSQDESTAKQSSTLEDTKAEAQSNIKDTVTENVFEEKTTELFEESSTNEVECVQQEIEHQDEIPMEIGQENLESCSLKGEIVEQPIQKAVEPILESIDDTLVTDAEVAEAVNTISESLDDTLVTDTEVVKTTSKSPDVTLVTDVEEAETVETISESLVTDAEIVKTISESMDDTLLTDAEVAETISESLVTDAETVETISESLVTDAETVETISESLVTDAEAVETISESLVTDAETVETISESLITDAETVETISEMADDTLVTDEKVAETISESIDDTHVTDAEVAETVETISKSIEDTLVTDAEVAETVETISESIDDTLVTDAEVAEAVVTISEPMNNTLVTHAKVAETISESIDDTLVTDTEVVETVKAIPESLDDTIVTEMEVVETVTEEKLDSSSEDIIKAAESSNDDNHSEENSIEKQEPSKSDEITEKEQPVEVIAEQIQPSSSETQVEVVQENTSETISSICEPSEEQEQDNIDTQPIQMGDHKVEQRLENVDQVSIECVSDRGDAEMVEEDKKIELTEPMKKSDEEPCSISTPEAEKPTTEDTASDLPEVSEVDDLKTNIVDNEEPDSIPTQNIEEFMDVSTEPSESAVDPTTDNSELKSTEDNLVPVEEEPCVKKVIIYEHDCQIDQTEDKSGNDAAILSTHITETQEKEPEDPLVQEAGEFCSTVSDDLDRKKVESEEPTISQDEDPAVIEEVFEQQEQIVHEDNIQSNQTEEVSSSDQQEIPELAEKTHENVDHNAEPTMEDQTSAAVQSILDNMLTEERSRERVIEKEEPQVVHSSYSSYEVQKAVQEIQGISLPENIVEMSAEEIECISSSEKLCESEKAVLEENIAVPNMGDQKEVEPEIGESEALKETTISKPDSVQTIETTEYVGPEEMFKDKVESIDESPNSPLSNTENQESVTHSDVLDGEDADARITEQVPSAAKYSSETRDQQDPVVIPSIDLSEESSSEDASDEDNRHVVSSSVQSNFFMKESHADIKAASSKTPSKADKVSSNSQFKNESKKFSPRETRHSSRISEKLKPHSLKDDIDQPLSVNIDDIEREKPYSPKITIKPIKEDEPNEDKEEHKGSLKITITKQSDNTHSILKMCSPDVDHRQKQTESEESNVVPKLVIKTSDTHSEQNSPKISTRSSKQVIPANSNIRSGSPRITIKPIVKPEVRETIASPLKITIKPIGKPEEFSRQQQRHSPKQSKNKSDDDHYSTRSKVPKTSENSDVHSPKVTIKPVKHPEESEVVSTPKITIKPIEKPEEARVSPKITIKPVVRPIEVEAEVEDEVKERIVLKINKGNLPAKDTERIGRESRKRELEDDKSEKLAKIKLKFSKDGDAHIVHKGTDTPTHKRQHDFENERSKRFKADVTTDSDDDVKLIENTQSPIVISEDSQSQDSVILIEDAKDPLALAPTPEPITPVVPVSAPRKRGRPRKVPLVVREDFGSDMKDRMTQPITPVSVSSVEQPAEGESTGRPKRSCRAQSVRDTLGIKPRKPSKPRGGKRGAKANSSKAEKDHGLLSVTKIEVTPRSSLTEEALQDARSSKTLKVEEVNKEEQIKPFGLKRLLEAAIDQNIIEVIEIDSPSNSPKCLDKIEDEDGVVEVKPLEYIANPDKDISFSGNIGEIKEFEIQKVESLNDGCNKDPSEFGGADAAASDVEMQPPTPVFAPPLSEVTTVDINSTTDIAMFEEETRMSADANSRAQTPAKQVVSADVVVEESQSSVQSTATTESGKISRRSRLEVHQDQDGSVFTADQLNEYYWGGNGPFMIQEQVAQFLGIKSFKRKYPGIPRRMVDMQERDYIRENGLASESMCDLGLTAVNSADILDIMYTDFQEKYEEFCRFQRDKQAKDLLNKQKALSLATNQEKSKLDILEQAVQSAAAYNANFNKTRREQRRACMDLQTMNIHYPKGRLKKISMPKIGNYPVAVVPGQFTDYYKEFTPTELNNLPLNTMLYTELHKILPEASDSDSDSSGSDSDDSSSSGSESNSSCEDNCKMCEKGSLTPRKSPVHSSL